MSDIFSYPGCPGFKERHGTSEDAARRIEPVAGTLRSKALDVLKARYPDGLTADQIAAQCGETVLAMRPRVTELYKLGFIDKTDQSGRNTSGCTARVWRLSPPPIQKQEALGI